MQKKNRLPQESSTNWQENIKKQERANMFKKIMIWGSIITVSILGLAGLVMLANKTPGSGSTSAPVENANLPKMKSNDIVVGDRKAKVTITEYADLQCPACASYNPLISKILEDYKTQVNLVYRFFPLRGVHKNALISAQAAYAAHKLGKFVEMKDLLYTNQADWENIADPREIFSGYASSIGLKVDEFNKIMNSDEAKKVVEDGEKESISIGINSTPTIFIGNKQIRPANYDDFKKLIDEELKNSGTEIKPTTKPLR